jgi:hypothetical protein
VHRRNIVRVPRFFYARIKSGATRSFNTYTCQFHDDYAAFADAQGLCITPKCSHFEKITLGMLVAQARAYQAFEVRIAGNPIWLSFSIGPVSSTLEMFSIDGLQVDHLCWRTPEIE